MLSKLSFNKQIPLHFIRGNPCNLWLNFSLFATDYTDSNTSSS